MDRLIKKTSRFTVAVLCVLLVGLCLSCVKQKNCEEGMSGTFKYLKEPMDSYNNKKITAIFYIDGDTVNEKYIIGHIPKEYQSNELIKVRVCLQEDKARGIVLAIYAPTYKLKCIEKED